MSILLILTLDASFYVLVAVVNISNMNCTKFVEVGLKTVKIMKHPIRISAVRAHIRMMQFHEDVVDI